MQKLYAKYRDQDFELLAFPCDQFGHQEPGSDSEIKSFCELNYGVEFPLFSKIDVNGSNEHPLYKFLKSEKGGLIGDSIKWNFTKFLGGQKGQRDRALRADHTSRAIAPDIEKLLAK